MNANPRIKNPASGYQLTFFTQQDHRHHGKSLAHWLVEEARALGIGGATLIAGSKDSDTIDAFMRRTSCVSPSSRKRSSWQ